MNVIKAMKQKPKTSSKRINMYLPFVEYLAEVLGSDSEVVLHDLSDPQSSIVSIKNNHISGRDVGESISDFALEVVKQSAEKNLFIKNEKVLNGRIVRSSTYFIRDDKNEVVGMLCINTDLSKLLNLKMSIDSFMGNDSDDLPISVPEKKYNMDIYELANSIINNILVQSPLPFERATPDEKMDIVRKFNATGVFQVKGIVMEVAEKLGVSEATIYRYLNKAERVENIIK